MGNKRKGLMIIFDGIGDRPVAELGGLTPLEAAHTPNLDYLARRGLLGMMDPLFPGLPVATDVGVGALMGMPLTHTPTARGPIEALGVGLDLAAEDLAWRCNFATVYKEPSRFSIQDRRGDGITQPDTGELAAALNAQLGMFDGILAQVSAATAHRGVLVLKGENLSEAVTDADPGAGWEANGLLRVVARHDKDEASRRTARALNYFIRQSHAIMRNHPVNQRRLELGMLPANILLPRKGGRLNPMLGLTAKMRLRTAVVAGERTVIGLGRLLGMETLVDASFTSDGKTNLVGKCLATLAALERSDLVFLHLKAPDVYSHDRDGLGKQWFIERADALLAPLLESQELAIVVTGDHSTPCQLGRHSGDPVPALLASPGGRHDAVPRFTEQACLHGGLGRITAAGLLWSLLDQMGAVGTFRPSDLPYIGYPVG